MSFASTLEQSLYKQCLLGVRNHPREINLMKFLLFHTIFVIVVALLVVQKTPVFGCVAVSATPLVWQFERFFSFGWGFSLSCTFAFLMPFMLWGFSIQAVYKNAPLILCLLLSQAVLLINPAANKHRRCSLWTATCSGFFLLELRNFMCPQSTANTGW